MRESVVVGILLLTAGCTQVPTAPDAPLAPIVLSGQSNAVTLAPVLQSKYAGRVIGAWESGLSIAFWGTNDRMWYALRPALQQNPRAFVFWQGESDCSGLSTAVPDYAERFADLMARVRLEAGSPELRIVVVLIAPAENCGRVRSIQSAWVASDRFAAIVSTDDLGHVNPPADWHITEPAAVLVADRVLAAIH